MNQLLTRRNPAGDPAALVARLQMPVAGVLTALGAVDVDGLVVVEHGSVSRPRGARQGAAA